MPIPPMLNQLGKQRLNILDSTGLGNRKAA